MTSKYSPHFPITLYLCPVRLKLHAFLLDVLSILDFDKTIKYNAHQPYT